MLLNLESKLFFNLYIFIFFWYIIYRNLVKIKNIGVYSFEKQFTFFYNCNKFCRRKWRKI
jgi:hypothetical protein